MQNLQNMSTSRDYKQEMLMPTVRSLLTECNKSGIFQANQSSAGSSGISSALRLIVMTGHSACFTQKSLTVLTKILQSSTGIMLLFKMKNVCCSCLYNYRVIT